MKKHKQSIFAKNFNNVDSQDNCDDIHWSSSEASDCENKSCTLNDSFSNSRKIKRRKKVNLNLSNLDIIEVLPTKEFLESNKCNKQLSSPVLKSRCLKSFKNNLNIPSSPILTSKVQNNEKELSPVINSKLYQIAPNIKKRLFTEANQINTEIQSKLDIENTTDIQISETTKSSKSKTKFDLMKQVQSYFDSHFSSESLSQQSISECESTPQNTSKTSEELEISATISQTIVQPNQQNSYHSSCENIVKTKKKYKKDGLGYRLAGLIKKQNSNISLWQHEKFLATNSNFVIPTCEHWLFQIQNVQFTYGCYLIEAKDLNDERYLLIINSINVNCSFRPPNIVIKLYKPYNLLLIDNFKVIVNVCKFESLPLSM